MDLSLAVKSPVSENKHPKKPPKHQPPKTPTSLRFPFVDVFSDFVNLKTTFRDMTVTLILHHAKSSDYIWKS